MTKRSILFSLLVLFAAFNATAHSGKARFHIIIDTDGAPDDLRTLCMLLGNREAEVLAVTASEGALTPSDAARRVSALTAEFYHEGIPTGCGRAVDAPAPIWRRHAAQTVWADTPAVESAAADDLIARAVKEEEEKVIFVALGSLTNIYDAMRKNPDLKSGIERLVWYGSADGPFSGVNYMTDTVSARFVLESGIPVCIVSENPARPTVVTFEWIDSIEAVGTPYAAKIAGTHRSAPLNRLIEANHLKIWDELVALYLYRPELFDTRAVSETMKICCPKPSVSASELQKAALAILRGKPDSESRVFFGFPTSKALYADDVAPIIDSAIAHWGPSEWRAAVLTNELHGHLGIYATIGVKMGIRAREYFNIGVDDIAVVSFAGSTPPVSCMNDGLQVATGGTMGHGLITAVPVGHPRAEAEFSFKGRSIRLVLKPEYAERIREDVRRGKEMYGDSTQPYWQYIRSLALRYWADFDRHEIFELCR